MKMSIISGLLLLLLFPLSAGADQGLFAPPKGKTLLFVGQDRETTDRYVKKTRTIPGGTMFYTSIQEMKGLEGPVEYGSGSQDGNALLKRYRLSVMQIGLYMVDALDDTVAGKYDANLKVLARWIKRANRPVYLRIGYEFDNPEFRYEPEAYKRAFRYVVDFLRREEVNNVAFVWHSYVAQEYVRPWMNWYPGDKYVDWFAASVFSTTLVPAADHLWRRAKQHRKPFMIAEASPAGLYTLRGKLDWFNRVFRFIEEHDVEAFCYINSHWDAMPMFVSLKWGDARIEENRELKEMWLKEIGSSRYLKASSDLFRFLGYN